MAAPAKISGTERAKAVETNITPKIAEDSKTQGGSSEKAGEKKTIGKNRTKYWVAALIAVLALNRRRLRKP
jgi:hypothetical protein